MSWVIHHERHGYMTRNGWTHDIAKAHRYLTEPRWADSLSCRALNQGDAPDGEPTLDQALDLIHDVYLHGETYEHHKRMEAMLIAAGRRVDI